MIKIEKKAERKMPPPYNALAKTMLAPKNHQLQVTA